MRPGFFEKLLDRIRFVNPDDMQGYLLELAREKGFLETIFDSILEGIIVTSPEGRIVYLNRAACRFFGIEESDATGKPIGDVLRGVDWGMLKDAAHQIITREIEVFYPEHRLLNFYAVGLTSQTGPHAAIEGRAIILRDITESRQRDEQTLESEKLSALTLLAAGVAHEIGNPLNSLGIHLQLLERKIKKLPEQWRSSLMESVQVASQEVARLDGIISQFLRAVRPAPLNLRLENANLLLAEALDFLQPELRDRDILVEQELDAGVPMLLLDKDQFKQALYNIFRNSLQAMKSGGILRIQTTHDDTAVFIAISDTGGGIPPEQLGRIFEPYFTTKTNGSGLGLMIVQRIIRAHGGEVAIKSIHGQGVTVTLRLPRHDRGIRLLPAGSKDTEPSTPPH